MQVREVCSMYGMTEAVRLRELEWSKVRLKLLMAKRDRGLDVMTDYSQECVPKAVYCIYAAPSGILIWQGDGMVLRRDEL
jgi:hypothetical protein